MGPLISSTQRNRVLGYIEKGKAEGARILLGGGTPSHLEKGFYVEPTVFVDVTNDMTIAYQNPKRAKKLYKEIVPKAVDEYLDFIEKAKTQDDLQLLMNPVWHVHNSEVPKEDMIMSFSMLLNLVETSNADKKELLWKFVKKYKTNISEKDYPIFDRLVGYAIKYFNDVIKSQKKYKKPNNIEKKALEALVKTLDTCNDKMTPEDIQTLIYSTGKENGYSESLRDWFKLIYEVVFGDENGPRMGFFISFFGIKETKDLILNKIK